ncbi:MAG: class I SAM-dependent methyltransferase [Alphaproteobacteria bacterium]|nr:class I SAM-dependent methyltransferase [Alphaproteobacteria bacterium]
MERRVYARMGEVEDRHWWFVARRRILATVLERSALLPKSARVLEAGCGTGGNLGMLSRFGPVSAFEPDEAARGNASRDIRFDIRAGALPDKVPFAGERFDLIAVLDVLEHLGDDEGALRALVERLEPGGVILVSVPAFAFLWSRHDVRHHHIRRYTRASLLAVTRAAGLEPVNAGYFNTLLFPLIVVRRMLDRLFGLAGDDDEMPTPWLNRLLGAVFAFERRLVGRVRLPFGVSLLMLARKPR